MYIIYLRVSTEEQKRSGLGLEAQEKYCMDYISKYPGEYAIYKDEAVSGGLKLEDREGLNAAIEALKPGDVFLVSSRDRLGRDVVQNAIAEREIEKKKCKLVTCNQDDSNMDEGIARLMKTMIDAFAQYERYQISKRTKAALARKKAKGERIGHVPYGFRLDDNKNLVVNEDEAATLKRMYQLRTGECLPFREIAHVLNSEGYRNRSTSKRLSPPWNHGSTSRVWSNYTKIYGDLRQLA